MSIFKGNHLLIYQSTYIQQVTSC